MGLIEYSFCVSGLQNELRIVEFLRILSARSNVLTRLRRDG
jgi:hypothetical protein